MPALRQNDLDARVRIIASVPVFADWPLPALVRLAAVARPGHFGRGETILAYGQVPDAMVFVNGAAQGGVTDRGGRRITFELSRQAGLCGFAPMVDEAPMQHDVVAVSAVKTLSLPYAAVRKELAAEPRLWESLAREAMARARSVFGYMEQIAFDPPRVRAAAALVSLADGGDAVASGAFVIPMRLPLERLAEMLGVSRQWATALVRELTDAGLVEWRYGRITVLDLAGLRAIAASGVRGGAEPGDPLPQPAPPMRRRA
jgi:CRP/FNR family transcriptional regulator, cyclic AMP receptor protein